MKHIRIGTIIFGVCLGFSLAVSGQALEKAVADTSGKDSLVNVAFRAVDVNDLPSGVSFVNPSQYIDKNFSTYPWEGINAFIGGSNLWNIGEALLFIDGVPRSISEITTLEVEQITYLKGVNAIALYGSRAANGVVLITTKKGKIGDRKTNVYVNTGIGVPKSYPNYLGSADYMKYYNQALANDGLKALYDSATINNYANGNNPYRYPNVDYYSSDYLKKTFNSYTASADFSGGNDRARFFTQAGFQKQNSLLNFGEGKNDNYTRFNVRGNIDLKLNDFISTYINMSNVFYDLRSASGNYWDRASSIQPNRFAPLVPIDMISKDSLDAQSMANLSRHIINGKYLLGGSQQYITNPIGDVYAAGYSTYTSRQFQYTGGFNADLSSAIQGLSFNGQMSIDYSNSYMQSIKNTYSIYVPTWDSVPSSSIITGLTKYNKDSVTGNLDLSGNWNRQVIDFYLNFDYARTFNDNHNVSAMLLFSGFRARKTGDYQYWTNSNIGLQLGYNYARKYYVDFSSAIVNSTKLSSENRIAFSPTFGLGWVLSNEDFLKGSDIINHLKLSSSIGMINTDMDIENYFLYDEKYTSSAWYSWADGTYTSQTTTISRGANHDLSYAKRKELNFGLDGVLFNGLFDFRSTVFFIKKDGIPVQSYTQYPVFFRTYYPETSFVPYTNFEANSFKGFDFQINLNKKFGELTTTIGASGTFVSSEALVRDERFEDTYRNRAGQPVDAIFGLENDGFFKDLNDIKNSPVQKFGEVKPGDIKYKDQNGDGFIDERDEVKIGQWNSPFTFGVHFTAQWKNFTLFALGTGQMGGTGIKASDYYWVYGSKKYSEVVKNSWTEATKNTATYPRLTTLSGDNNFRTSDFWTYSTNRFDLAKVQLSYLLSNETLKKAYVKGINIYISGYSLLTISENKDIMELNIGTTPQSRFYELGLKAMF